MTGNSESKFSVTLSGDGISLRREIDRQTAVRVLNVVLGSGASVGGDLPIVKSAIGEAPARAPLSLREYLNDVQATRKPDQILAIAHFICEHERHEDFARDDIKARFLAAREPLPANFARDFAWTLKNGWIAEAHGRNNRYYVTSKGKQAVEGKFSLGIKRATAVSKAILRRRRAARPIPD